MGSIGFISLFILKWYKAFWGSRGSCKKSNELPQVMLFDNQSLRKTSVAPSFLEAKGLRLYLQRA